MAKVPQSVELTNFVDEEKEKPEATKPITPNKSERQERFDMRPGEVKVWRDHQRPEFKLKKVRKRKCAYCSFSFRGLKTVCPRCKNCQACGSYTGVNGDLVCDICGNTDTKPKEDIPTIIIN